MLLRGDSLDRWNKTRNFYASLNLWSEKRHKRTPGNLTYFKELLCCILHRHLFIIKVSRCSAVKHAPQCQRADSVRRHHGSSSHSIRKHRTCLKYPALSPDPNQTEHLCEELNVGWEQPSNLRELGQCVQEKRVKPPAEKVYLVL